MALAVLLYHISHIIRFPGLLEFPPGDEVFDLPDCPDGIPVHVSESKRIKHKGYHCQLECSI